jgi:hypothetical protein
MLPKKLDRPSTRASTQADEASKACSPKPLVRARDSDQRSAKQELGGEESEEVSKGRRRKL